VHELVFNMCDSNMHGERIKIKIYALIKKRTVLCREPLVIDFIKLLPLRRYLQSVTYLICYLITLRNNLVSSMTPFFGSTCFQESIMSYNLILNVTSGKRLTSNKGHDKFLLQSIYKGSLPRQRAFHIAFTLYLMFSWV
jgi:hypothetical protein